MAKKDKDIRALRSEAHKLKPVVRIGNKGLTEAVHAEVDAALSSHELIKVKVVADRDERDGMIAELAEQSGALLVGSIGQICILYRESSEG
jgi:RNA-binding protein